MSDTNNKNLEKVEVNGSFIWRLNTSGFLNEIASNNEMRFALIPLKIFGMLLAEVGERATELNDNKLNALMCRLGIYDISDPSSENFNPTLMNEIIDLEYKK